MKLYTSYYANYRKFPINAIPVAISLVVPDGFKGIQCKELAPSKSILTEYKNGGTTEHYTQRYTNEILSKLDADDVIERLYDSVNSYDDDDLVFIFLCYEKSGVFCHRHLFASWLELSGYECKELV